MRTELLRIETALRREQGEATTDHASELDVETVDPNRAPARPAAPPDGNEPRTVPCPSRLGRYQVTGTLGEGAFGVVYRGYDPELRRDVAIKVPRRQPAANSAGADDAYLAEARTVAALDHMGIVPVLDVGRGDDGLCYVVSKLMPKGDLAGLLAASRPSHEVAAGLIAQIADALGYAHQRGLVHRDIKPGNILLDEAGRPLLADFGLALNDEAFGSGSNCCGTPYYMSPEQARGEGHRVDARSDIYSLGVVLYELLAGRRPHRHTQMRDLLSEIAECEIRPPRQLDPSIPKELERICLKALARRAEDRYTTAYDLAEDLRQWQAGREQGAGNRGEGIGNREQGTGDMQQPSAETAPSRLPAIGARLPAERWAVAGVAIVAAIVLVGRTLTSDRNPTAAGILPASTEPAGETARPLRVSSIDVRHFTHTADGDVERGLLGKDAFTAALGDRVQVEARLTKAGYAYLIAFRPDGVADLCFPAEEDEPPPLTDTPRYPPADVPGKAYGLMEGTGLWAIAVVASETPLPAYRQWLRDRFARRQLWTPVEKLPNGIVWWDDGQSPVESLTANGAAGVRGKGESLETTAVVLRKLTDALHAPGGAEAVSALGFCVTPRE